MYKNLLTFILMVFLFIQGLHSIYAQTTQIKGFADVDAFNVSDSTHTNESKNYFRLGQFDLFVTSQVTDKISFLGENTLEFKMDSYNNTYEVYVQRLFLKYAFNDHFALTAGKVHSPLGYWNNAYHHGFVIQPTIDRPDVINFEHHGGILPIHETGVQVDAEHFTNSNIGINLLISNGLGSTPINDFNKDKAITVNLHAEPIENLKLFVSGYWNKAPADSDLTYPNGIQLYYPVTTQILNAAVAYMNGRWPVEFIGEYYNISQNEEEVGNKITNGLVLYGGYKIKRFTVYGMYESIEYPDGILVYIKNNTTSIIGGVRYKFSPAAVVKLQYHNYLTEAPTMVDHDRTGPQNIVEAQFAIGF